MNALVPAPDDALLAVRLRCEPRLAPRVRYTLETLLLAAGVPVHYIDAPPATGPWLDVATPADALPSTDGRRLGLRHDPHAWRTFEAGAGETAVDDPPSVPPAAREDARRETLAGGDIGYDLLAASFHFLSSWGERRAAAANGPTRQLYAGSETRRLGVPQDVVDRYLLRLRRALADVYAAAGRAIPPWPAWPDGARFALVLSHDVDYLPTRPGDNAVQGAKAVMRHLVRQRDPGDALRAGIGYLKAVTRGRDPYGCVPEIIARESALGLRSSFQVAVGHRHPADVNYRIDDDRVRDYLRAIVDAGFDLCLHGSYRSTEEPQWYLDEVELLAERLGRPAGSRQHFLSFNYDRLFATQERAGIRYDMSMGYPDQPGPRAGFSHPYFPYDLAGDRPYRVVQLSLFLMDVTLRSYQGLRPGPARAVIADCLAALQAMHGCASAVWHPIVFGNARDPGYGELYFDMAAQVRALGGVATDGRTVDTWWRRRACAYPSLAAAAETRTS